MDKITESAVYESKGLRSLGLAATTDADGRFALRGLGVHRMAWLKVTGPTICEAKITVVTRPGPIRTYPTAPGSRDPEIVLHPPTVDLAVEVARVVSGTVRDAETGQPLAGWRMGVHCSNAERSNNPGLLLTDAEGRFRYNGVRRFDRLLVMAYPPRGQPYLAATLASPSTREPRTGPGAWVEPGGFRVIVDHWSGILPTTDHVDWRREVTPVDLPEDPADAVACDIRVRRTPLVRGRVTDKATGRPLRATIRWAPPPEGPVPTPKGRPWAAVEWGNTDLDGRYALAVPAGRGLVSCSIWGDPSDPGRAARYPVG